MRRLGDHCHRVLRSSRRRPRRARSATCRTATPSRMPGERMTCLYAHIAHLEQTLLSFSTDITDLRRELKEKLDANGVYKLQYVGKGICLGLCRQRQAAGVCRVATAPIPGSSTRIAVAERRAPPRGHRRRTSRPTRTKARARTRASQGQGRGQCSASGRASAAGRPITLSLKPQLSLRRTRSIRARGSSHGPACRR